MPTIVVTKREEVQLTQKEFERVGQIITDNGWGGTWNAESRALAQLRKEQEKK